MVTAISKSRKKTALLISSSLILLGLIDILLRILYLNSVSEGLYFSVHDPGRVVHSLILLPFSVFVMVLKFPLSTIKSVFIKYKVFTFSFIILSESLAVCQAYNDAKEGYYNRTPMPYAVEDGRDELVKMHHSIMAAINNYEKNAFSKKELSKNIKDLRKPYLDYVNKVKVPEPLFGRYSTFYTKYSIFLTWIGLSYVVFLFTVIGLFSIERKRIDDSFFKAIILNAAVLSSWFIFRAYSEWYLNLGDFDVQKDAKFLVLPFDTMVLLSVAFFLHQKKKFLSYATSSFAILMAIAIIIVRLNPDLFFSSINFPSDISMVNIVSMLITGFLGTGAVLWNFRSKLDEVELLAPKIQSGDSFGNLPDINTGEQNSLSKFTLPDELSTRYTSKITKVLITEKLYLDPELTLNKFSKELKIPVHHLSYVLNEKMGNGFSDFINQHRVEEAKQKLKNPSLKNIKIENIGYECGFNSKATFYRVFKKNCNQSPSEFQKSCADTIIYK